MILNVSKLNKIYRRQSLTNTIIAGFKLDVERLKQVKCNTVKECSDPRYCYCHQVLKLCFCDPLAKQEFVAKVSNNR